MARATYLTDMFGSKIEPGSSFMRIESRMGGCSNRFYFFGGYTPDGKIYVKEYGGVPRTIKRPDDDLLLLTGEMLKAKHYTPPTLEEVTAPKEAAKKTKKPAPGEILQL